jgi:hypothetical protein
MQESKKEAWRFYGDQASLNQSSKLIFIFGGVTSLA